MPDDDLPDKTFMTQLNQALSTAIDAARAAAAVLQSYAKRRTELVIDHKGRNDLVSQADRLAEQACLSVLKAGTPAYGIARTGRRGRSELLDLGFLEGDVLADDGIVLFEFDLLRLGTGILLGDVVIAGVSGADELDEDCGALRHGLSP